MGAFFWNTFSTHLQWRAGKLVFAKRKIRLITSILDEVILHIGQKGLWINHRQPKPLSSLEWTNYLESSKKSG